VTSPVLHYVEREALILRRLWRGIVFSQFISPTLYLVAMGIGLGSLVDAAGTRLDGLTYLEFVAPGLMAATVMQSSTGEALWPVLAGFKWMGFYHGMAASPMRPTDVYVGNLAPFYFFGGLIAVAGAGAMGGVPAGRGRSPRTVTQGTAPGLAKRRKYVQKMRMTSGVAPGRPQHWNARKPTVLRSH